MSKTIIPIMIIKKAQPIVPLFEDGMEMNKRIGLFYNTVLRINGII